MKRMKQMKLFEFLQPSSNAQQAHYESDHSDENYGLEDIEDSDQEYSDHESENEIGMAAAAINDCQVQEPPM